MDKDAVTVRFVLVIWAVAQILQALSIIWELHPQSTDLAAVAEFIIPRTMIFIICLILVILVSNITLRLRRYLALRHCGWQTLSCCRSIMLSTPTISIQRSIR